MKPLNLFKLLIFIFLLKPSFAQITINSTDIAGVGDTLIQSVDTTVTAGLSPGGTGMQTWDFSSLTASKNDTLIFISGSQIPDAQMFPSTNLAVKILGTGESGNLDTSYIYLYKTNDYLHVLGMNISTFGAIAADPYQNVMPFPVTYGDEFYSDYDFSVEIYETDTIMFKSNFNDTVLVDAYGTITLPSGSFETLRFYHKILQTDSAFIKTGGNWVLIDDTTRQKYRYEWWTNDPSVRMKVMEIETDDSGNVTSHNFVSESFIHSSGTAGIIHPEIVEPKIIVESGENFITITGIPENFKSIDIYDVSGKKVFTGKLNGDINIYTGNFKNGVYILNFKSKNLTFSRKTVINR